MSVMAVRVRQHMRCPGAVERFHAPINTVAHMGEYRERIMEKEKGGGGQAEGNGTKLCESN